MLLGALRLASILGVGILIFLFAIAPPGLADLAVGAFAGALGLVPIVIEMFAGRVREAEIVRAERVLLLRADHRPIEPGALSYSEPSPAGRLSNV